MAYLSLIYTLDKEYVKQTEIDINMDMCDLFFEGHSFYAKKQEG